MEYTFTLKYQLPALDSDIDDVVERLGASGCNDALVGIGLPGRVALMFGRESGSAHEAIVSALVDVRRAVPDATLIEATPDFVGLTDVAEVVGVSRQNMRKLMTTHPASFPAPVHEGAASVWHLADVLRWLAERGSYAVEPSLIDVAETTMQVNLARGAKRIAPEIGPQLAQLVG